MSNQGNVLISGASSGIGKATAIRFAAEGWNVCINARRESLLEEIREGLPDGNHLVCPGDYSDPDVTERIRQSIATHWGHVDVLVNSAGISRSAHIVDSPLDEWRIPFDTMFNGAVNLTRAVVPLMPRDGRIIHITSIHGGRAEAGTSSYAMAKAAINQYCHGLAIELAPRGILVNAIAPGFIRTPMGIRDDGVNELDSEWFDQNYVTGSHLPLKRAGRPEEIAGVCFFLASPDATYITGQVITVDGGLTITF